MTNNELDSKNMTSLLAAAAKGLGTTPEALRSQLEKGQVSGLPADQSEMLKRALTDEKVRRQVLESPQARALIAKLTGGR